MEINIYALLQQENVAKTTNKIIKYLLEGCNADNLNQIMLQFFVDVAKRNKEITAEELENIESSEDLNEFIHLIYCSSAVDDETEVVESVRNFIHMFIGEAFAKNLLKSMLVINWITWLQLCVEHPEIPDDSIFKQGSLHLLSLFLIPFARLAEIIPVENDESSNDLGASIFMSLSTIFELIPSAFKYKMFCVNIAKEFIDTVETHNEIMSEQKNIFQVYKSMMLVENHGLHVMALKSLVKLCGVEIFHAPLKVLFNENPPAGAEEFDEDKSFKNILLEFISRKNLKLEMMALLKEMKKLEEISGDIQVELYMTIFNKSKKLVAETLDVMTEFGDDVWLQIINLLNYHVTEAVDYQKLFENLSSVESFCCDVKDLLRITVENLNTPEIAHRAMFIVIQILKHDRKQQEEVLQVIEKLLTESLRDEESFMLLVECLNVIDIEILSKFLKSNPANLVPIVKCLLKAFLLFDTPMYLYNIIAVLKKITKVSPEYTLSEVRRVFKQLYLDLLHADNLFSADRKQNLVIYKKPITKITVLTENRAWNLMNGKTMKMIHAIGEKLFPIAGEEDKDNILSTLVRFFTNFYKHLWTRVLLKKPIPFEPKEVVNPLKEFYEAFEGIINCGELNLEDGHLILTSFMDLLVMFQPSMREKSNHVMFKGKIFGLDKKGVNRIAALIEKLVFTEGSESKNLDDSTIFQSEFILESWISFCRNYEALPSLTASEKIIRHYTFKHPLKDHIETLMDHLMTMKNIFEQTIAFVTLNLSNQNDLVKFRQFHHGLEIYFSQKFSDVKSKLPIILTICSYILTKLDVQINSIRVEEGQDRLMVLDYVNIFTKNMSSTMKKILVTYIPLEEDKENLSQLEKEHLIAFKAQNQ